jgi:hypothetical protein
MLEVCAALTAICKIVTEDMIPAVITDVSDVSFCISLLLLYFLFFVLTSFLFFSPF